MTETWGLTSGEWTATYTLLTAGLLLVAIAAALYARDQVRASRTLQRETTRPYVIVTVESSPIGWRVLDLVVRNIGQRPAYNVRLALDPEPIRTEETPEAPLNEVRMLTEPIGMLAPGQELRTYYDQMELRLNSDRNDLPMSHDYTVDYDEHPEPDDKDNRHYCDRGVADLNALGGALQPDVYNIHHVVTTLRDIKKQMAKAERSAPASPRPGCPGAGSRAEQAAQVPLEQESQGGSDVQSREASSEKDSDEPSSLLRLHQRFRQS